MSGTKELRHWPSAAKGVASCSWGTYVIGSFVATDTRGAAGAGCSSARSSSRWSHESRRDGHSERRKSRGVGRTRGTHATTAEQKTRASSARSFGIKEGVSKGSGTLAAGTHGERYVKRTLVTVRCEQAAQGTRAQTGARAAIAAIAGRSKPAPRVLRRRTITGATGSEATTATPALGLRAGSRAGVAPNHGSGIGSTRTPTASTR